MVRTWAVLLAVAAVGVAATVDGVRRTGEGPADADADAATETAEADATDRVFSGADAPTAGALPGTLVVVSERSCRLRLIHLAALALGEIGPRTACGAWPSPAGGHAAVTLDSQDGQPAPWARLGLVRLGDPPELLRALGPIEGEATWSPDGAAVAWCTLSGDTVVQVIATGVESRVEGCTPRFAPDGSLLTTPLGPFSGEVLRDGERVLGPLDLMRGFDASMTGDLDVLAYDESPDGLLAVSVLRLEPLGSRAVLELWQDGAYLGGIDLPRRFGNGPYRVGEYLRFNPSGTVLAVGPAPRDDSMTFVDLRVRRPSLALDHQRAYAWSPDGAWLAVALDDGIAFYSANGSEPVYRVPVRAVALGWLPSSADG